MPNTFHIRDRNTGLFYQKYAFDYAYDWRQPTPPCSLIYAPSGFGKAFKDLGKLRVHLLYLIGNMDPPRHIIDMTKRTWEISAVLMDRTKNDPEYIRLSNEIDCWHELHPGYRNVPDFMSNRAPLDELPASWEVVEVTDKKSGQWTLIDFDPAAYAKSAQKLRQLTDTYGSAVRELYQKLEKAQKLESMPWMVSVMPEVGSVDRNWWTDAIIDTTGVDAAVVQMGLKRSQMMRSSKKVNIAIALRSYEEAVFFKMCYNGPDRVAILDINRLIEIVEQPDV